MVNCVRVKLIVPAWEVVIGIRYETWVTRLCLCEKVIDYAVSKLIFFVLLATRLQIVATLVGGVLVWAAFDSGAHGTAFLKVTSLTDGVSPFGATVLPR